MQDIGLIKILSFTMQFIPGPVMKLIKILLLIFSGFPVKDLYCQSNLINPSLLQKPWKAYWITGPGRATNIWSAHSDPSLKEYAVYKFRKSFNLAAKPSSFIVHVSADNRYKLFVNEKLVSLGPARGDLYFWNFETVDLASFLQPGKNTVAAIVWNDGK